MSGLRDFVTGADACGPSDGQGPSNAASSLADALIGGRSKHAEQRQELPGMAGAGGSGLAFPQAPRGPGQAAAAAEAALRGGIAGPSSSGFGGLGVQADVDAFLASRPAGPGAKPGLPGGFGPFAGPLAAGPRPMGAPGGFDVAEFERAYGGGAPPGAQQQPLHMGGAGAPVPPAAMEAAFTRLMEAGKVGAAPGRAQSLLPPSAAPSVGDAVRIRDRATIVARHMFAERGGEGLADRQVADLLASLNVDAGQLPQATPRGFEAAWSGSAGPVGPAGAQHAADAALHKVGDGWAGEFGALSLGDDPRSRGGIPGGNPMGARWAAEHHARAADAPGQRPGEAWAAEHLAAGAGAASAPERWAAEHAEGPASGWAGEFRQQARAGSAMRNAAADSATVDHSRKLAETLATSGDPKMRDSQFLKFVSKMSRGELIVDGNDVKERPAGDSWAGEFAQAKPISGRQAWAGEFVQAAPGHAWAGEFAQAGPGDAWAGEFGTDGAARAAGADPAPGAEFGGIGERVQAVPPPGGWAQELAARQGRQHAEPATSASAWAEEFSPGAAAAAQAASQAASQAAPWAEEFSKADAALSQPGATAVHLPEDTDEGDWARAFENGTFGVPGTGAEWASEFAEAAKVSGGLPPEAAAVWEEEFARDLEGLNGTQGVRSVGDYVMADGNPFLDDPDALSKGRELFRRGVLTEAALALEAAAARDPTSAEAWRLLGTVHAENDDDLRAIRAMTKALQASPDDPDVLLALGVSHTNELDAEEAAGYLLRWAETSPETRAAAERAGGSGAPPGASAVDRVRALLGVLSHDPETSGVADVHVARGVAATLARDHDGAADAFQSALTIRPQDYSLWNKLGATLANSSHSAEALTSYRRALETKPNYVRAWTNLGISHTNLGEYDAAARFYVRALTLNPQATSVWGYLRTALVCADRPDLQGAAAAEDLDALRAALPL